MVSQETKQAFWEAVRRNGDKFRRNGRIGRRNSDGRWFLPDGQANKQMVTVTLENQLEVLADRGGTMPSAGTHVRVNRVDGAFVIEGLAVQGSNTSRPASEANTDIHNHNKGYRHFYPVDSDSLLDGGITITPNTSNVTFKRKQYRDADGKPKIYAGGDTVDMSAYGTGLSAGEQAWVLAYITPSTGALTLYEAAAGSAPLNSTTDLDDAISDFYDNVDSGEPYRAIRVNKGAIPYSVYKPAEGYTLDNKDMIRFQAVPRYKLEQLTDVDLTSIVDGAILKYNAGAQEWADSNLQIDELGDVNTSAPFNSAHYLGYDAGVWVNRFIRLDELGNVRTDDVTTGNILIASGGAFESHPLSVDDVQEGTLDHEYGGLEADVSSYAGVPLISGGSTSEIKYNLTATTDPDANDDSGSGYAIGSLWVNTDRDRVWQCANDTASSAVWKLISGEYGVELTKSSNQIITDTSTDIITFDGTVGSDPDSLFDDANDTIDVGIAGTYMITFEIFVTYVGDANCQARIVAGGNTSRMRFDATSAFATTLSRQVTLDAGDTIEGGLFYNNNTNNSNNGTISGSNTNLSAFLVSR